MLRKMAAILDNLRLEEVEKALLMHGVTGLTVHKVKGQIAYFDSYSLDPLTSDILIEVFTVDHQAKKVPRVIINAAHCNTHEEGLVCITPVEDLFWIHPKKACRNSNFVFKEASL